MAIMITEAPSVVARRPWGHCFTDANGAPARIELEQIDARSFKLLTSLRFEHDNWMYEVKPSDLPKTDLASVPGPVRWFLSRYGLHTPAALLHDHLVRAGLENKPRVTREDADGIFRAALARLGVPPLRRTLMWAAVVLGTRWKASLGHKLAIALWGLASIAGTAAVVAGAVTGDMEMLAVSLLAPLPFSVLWGRQYPAGIVAAYSAPWVLPPTILSSLGYAVYWLLERIALFVMPTTRRAKKRPTPYLEF